MYVYVVFDVEDLVHPESDDVPRDIAHTLSGDGVVATMCVVGQKARLWEERGRRDVIAEVGQHDVCLHSDSHSIHPTVAEYESVLDWHDGVDEALAREGRGARDLARIFRAYPSSWGTPGSSWAPQIPAATRLLGIPSNIYSHGCLGCAGACWFAGQLCYPNGLSLSGGEDTFCDDASFEARLPELLAEVEALINLGTPCVLVFGGHPTRFRYTAFWDALNYSGGHNIEINEYRTAPRRGDSAYQSGLRNLRRMLQAVRALPGVQFTSPRALNGHFALPSGPIAWDEVRRLACAVLDSSTIRTDNPIASPAQALDLLARAVLRRAHGDGALDYLPTRMVLGPTERPRELTGPVGVSPARGMDLCRALVAAVDASGHLPTALVVEGVSVGPGPMLRAVAAALLALDRTTAFTGLMLTPGPEEPDIAAELVQKRIYDSLPGWPPHDPGLRLDAIALHTRLQTWSLKPAVLA
jgi:hypothetical protein